MAMELGRNGVKGAQLSMSIRHGRVSGIHSLTRSLALALVVAFAATPAAPASAGTDPDQRKAAVDRSLAKARGDLEDLSENAKTTYFALRGTQLAIPAAKRALANAQSSARVAEARKLALDAELMVAKQALQVNQAALDANAKQVDHAEDRRDELARKAYEGGGLESFAPLSLLIGPGDAQDLSDRLYYVEKASDRQHAVLGDLDDARQAALIEQRRLEDARRRVAQLNLQAKAALTQAAQAKKAAGVAEAQMVHLAAVQNAQLAAVARRVNAEKRRVDALQASSDKLSSLLAARARARRAATSAPRAASTSQRYPARARSGALAQPVAASITSEFGMRHHPILRYARLHAGTDFGAGCGTPVYAANAGEIVQAGWAGGYGNAVVVAHSDSLATTYNHLSSVAVRGGSVARGQLLGYVGTTGLSTGCHLHFEVRVNGVPVNPRGYL